MNEMNIFIVNQYAIPPSLGGLARHYYMSRYLTKQGHQVRILSSSQVHNTQINFAENHQLINEKNLDGVTYTFVKTVRYDKNNWRRILNILQFPVNTIRAIRKLAKQGDKPNVFYLSSPTPFYCFAVMLYAKQKKIPCVLEVRDLWPLSIVEYSNLKNSNPVIKALYRLEKWLYRHASQLIFTMGNAEQYILDQGWEDDIDLNKIQQINNGVDLAEFNETLEKYHHSDSELDNPDIFKIVFTGSVRHIYQLHIIVETAKLCQSALPKVRFFIYGDGPEKEKLIELAKSYKLDNIYFCGKIEKKYIPSVLARADITLLHSKEVNLTKYGISQNKLFEYAAAKKPILSTLKQTKPLIEENNCGITVTTQDPENIFAAIKKFVAMTEGQRHAMGENAFNLALEHDYPALTEKLLAVLKKATTQS